MSINWKKPLRIVDIDDLEVTYLFQLDNVSETLHLIKVSDQTIAIGDDGVLPGEDSPWIENIPEEKWKIVATTKQTFSSKEEAELAVSGFLGKTKWNIECVKT